MNKYWGFFKEESKPKIGAVLLILFLCLYIYEEVADYYDQKTTISTITEEPITLVESESLNLQNPKSSVGQQVLGAGTAEMLQSFANPTSGGSRIVNKDKLTFEDYTKYIDEPFSVNDSNIEQRYQAGKREYIWQTIISIFKILILCSFFFLLFIKRKKIIEFINFKILKYKINKQHSKLDSINKLNELKEKGILTDEEFNEQKKKLLEK